MFGLITRKQHEAALALMAKANVDLEQERDELRTENSRLRSDVMAAEMAYDESRKAHGRLAGELALLRPDAEKYRRSRANLKQFRDKGVA